MAVRYSEDEKKAAVQEWLAGGSYRDISKKMKIASGMLSAWKRKYFPTAAIPSKKSNGEAVEPKEEAPVTKGKRSNRYPQEVIEAAVRRFNAKEASAIELAKEYGTSNTMIYTWVKKAKKQAGQARVAMANGMSAQDLKSKKPHIARDDILKDAILYLRRGRDSVMSGIRNGDLKAPDEAHNLLMLALSILDH